MISQRKKRFTGLCGEPLEQRMLLTADLVADINLISAHSSNPRDFVAVNELVFFVADSELGAEVWRTDGTAEGTSILRDIALGAASSNPFNLAATATHLFFETRNGVWASDGTTDGTILTEGFSIIATNNVMALLEVPGGIGVTDGTSSRVPRVFFNDDALQRQPGGLLAVTEEQFLVGMSRNVDLIQIEDVLGNTEQVADNLGVTPTVVPVGDQLLIFESDGELRKVGESESELVATLPDRLGNPGDSVVVTDNGTAFFVVRTVDGVQLWKSDLTAAGTSMLASFAPASSPVETLLNLTTSGEALWFTAWQEETGRELWTSNGTAEGTRMVLDVAEGDAGSFPHDLTAVEGGVLLVADDGSGEQIWFSDGATETTLPVTDLPADSEGSARIFGTTDAGGVFFRANSELGTETVDLDARRWRAFGRGRERGRWWFAPGVTDLQWIGPVPVLCRNRKRPRVVDHRRNRRQSGSGHCDGPGNARFDSPQLRELQRPGVLHRG